MILDSQEKPMNPHWLFLVMLFPIILIVSLSPVFFKIIVFLFVNFVNVPFFSQRMLVLVKIEAKMIAEYNRHLISDGLKKTLTMKSLGTKRLLFRTH